MLLERREAFVIRIDFFIIFLAPFSALGFFLTIKKKILVKNIPKLVDRIETQAHLEVQISSEGSLRKHKGKMRPFNKHS